MNFVFESQGTNTYLVYEIGAEDTIDTMSLGMLTNNNIPGLAPAIFTQMDATKYIKYNVSAKVSVKQFFEGQVNKKRLLGVFNGIINAMMSAEEYMIDINSILLDFNYIFADVSTCETVLICLPIAEANTGTDLGSFFKSIMFGTQFDQTENCDHVAKIINYLNSNPVFSLSEFKKVIDSIGNSGVVTQTPVQQPRVEPAPMPKKKPIQKPVQQPQSEIRQENPTVATVPVQLMPQSIPNYSKQNAAPVATPPVNIPVKPNAKESDVPNTTEKPMSFFYLMQHYSKENKAIYDAQKAAKKTGKNNGIPTPPPAQPKKQPNTGFAIPGAPQNAGFAIPGQPASQVNQAQQQPQKPVQKPVAQPKQQPVQVQQPTYTPPAYTTPAQPQGQSASFGETTVLGGGKIGETTVLGAGSPEVQIRPHLIRTKNNEHINLDKPVFRIGKEKSYVDYFVSDNTAVSRSHCNIITRDGQYFIVDTNSTNHTYVNGGMIQSNVETQLSHGMKIRLANEDFEFRLY